MKRRLALHSEYLSDLSTTELASVAGGIQSDGCMTGVYPTLNTPCNTDKVCLAVDRIPSYDCFTGTSAHTAVC
ncbi:MAG TPA: hypothetical protein VGX28_05635 [Frankiaceae bacterium]|jgi:hypothetical protein|nr:hypothetical protein [Frankiaceae bacterium]